jgi:hypothetical protein
VQKYEKIIINKYFVGFFFVKKITHSQPFEKEGKL